MNKIPKLRFPEFTGEWKSNSLGNLGVFFKGSTLSKANLSAEGKSCILYGELYTKYGEVIKNIVSKTDIESNNLVIGNKNDVLVPSSGETAIDIATASCLQQDDILLGGDLNVFRPNNANGVFISYQLNNSKRKDIAKVAQGASVVHIYNDQLKKLIVDIPQAEEQEKIAAFFSLIDKNIEKQQKKVEALKEYKKGIMQKIFSQEIRFDGYTDKWKTDKLKNYTEKITKKNKDYSVTNVISNSAKNGLIAQRDYFDKAIANKDNINGYYTIELGDFVYNPRKSTESPYGPVNRYLLAEKGVVSPLYLCFKVNEKINGEFLSYFFKSDKWYRFIYLNSDQGARHDRVSIKDSEFFNLEINIPTLIEQEKIALFLSLLNKKYLQEQDKLMQLNKWKKGLIQQMFV